jgi:hypothetical protein
MRNIPDVRVFVQNLPLISYCRRAKSSIVSTIRMPQFFQETVVFIKDRLNDWVFAVHLLFEACHIFALVITMSKNLPIL